MATHIMAALLISSNSKQHWNDFKCKQCKLWNALPTELKSASSVNSFKHKLKHNCFDQLQKDEENPYIFY